MTIRPDRVDDWFNSRMVAGVPQRHAEFAEGVRKAALSLGQTIREGMPAGPDQSKALSRLRDALDAVVRGLKTKQ